MRTLLLTTLFFMAFPAWAEEVRLQDDAPQQHVVVKGDTLWGISATFLKDPWQWPNVWRLNRAEIKNPHLIYPGDVVRLSRDANGNAQLTLDRGPRFNQTVKLSPIAHAEPIIIKESGIPSIPEQAISALLSRGGVAEPGDLAQAPRILGSSDERVMFGLGDQVYAGRGDGHTVDWHIVRLGQPIPGREGDVLAYELIDVGEAQTVQDGDPQRLRITRSEQEALERDHLLPAWKSEPIEYIPHAPDKPISARIATTLDNRVNAGAWTTVVIDRGLRDGLEEGHVLALFRTARSIADPKCTRADKIAFLAGGVHHVSDCKPDDHDTTLPDTRIGLAFVYRVFNKVAYALVMKSTEQVAVGDIARNP